MKPLYRQLKAAITPLITLARDIWQQKPFTPRLVMSLIRF